MDGRAGIYPAVFDASDGKTGGMFYMRPWLAQPIHDGRQERECAEPNAPEAVDRLARWQRGFYRRPWQGLVETDAARRKGARKVAEFILLTFRDGGGRDDR